MFWSLFRIDARSRRAVCRLALAALLSLSARAAVAQPSKLFLNKNAQALSIGLTFHPDVPDNIRKAIIEDLDWLSGRAAIKDERLRYLLQINEPVTGASLVAWFLDRIHVIGLSGWCPSNDFTVIRFESGKFIVNKASAICSPLTATTRAAVLTQTFYRDLLSNTAKGIALDRKVRIVPDSWPDGFTWPAMLVAPTFVRGEPTIHERAIRLSVLLHEASHVEAIPHGLCRSDDWRHGKYAIGPLKFPIPPSVAGQRNCDNPAEGSAHTIEASFLRVIALLCDCAQQESLKIKFQELVTWSNQNVPLKEPLVVPSSGELESIQGLGGNKIRNFPPAEFMEAGLDYVEMAQKICQDRCARAEELRVWKRQFTALREFGRDLNKRKAFAGSWESSKPDRRPIKRPLDVAGAKKWLAAAVKAAKDGYNVEMISLVSCANLQDKC